MNQSVKVLLACALGAFVGSLAALQVNHNFWWVGLVAGFPVGWLAYDFKGAIRAASIAWRATAELSAEVRMDIAVELRKTVRNPHPFFFFSLVLTAAFLGVMSYYAGTPPHVLRDLLFFITAGVIQACIGCALCFLALLGAKRENCRWSEPTSIPAEEGCQKEGTTIIPATYRNISRLVLKGVLDVFLFFVWYLWKNIVLGIGYGIYYGAIYLSKFFRLAHSEIRLLCGIDAAIGAAIGYHYHSVFIGMIAGGIWGALNFEILSIRVFKYVPASRSIFH